MAGGVESDDFRPFDCARIVAEIIQEFPLKAVQNFLVFTEEGFIALLGLVSERLDEVGVHGFITGNKLPEALATEFEVVPFVRISVASVATTIDRRERMFWAKNLSGLQEIILHLLDL